MRAHAPLATPATHLATTTTPLTQEESEITVAWLRGEPHKYVSKPGGNGAWLIPLKDDERESTLEQQAREELWRKAGERAR